MTFSRRTVFLTAFATFALGSSASAAPFAPAIEGADAMRNPPLLAHHRYWHHGGRGRHLGWYKQKRGKHKGWNKYWW